MARTGVETQEKIEILGPPGRAEPLPHCRLGHLGRGLGGVHHLEVQHAFGPPAAPILHRVTQRAGGAREAGLRHEDQRGQLLRPEPVITPQGGGAVAHYAAREATHGHHYRIAVRILRPGDVERARVDAKPPRRFDHRCAVRSDDA